MADAGSCAWPRACRRPTQCVPADADVHPPTAAHARQWNKRTYTEHTRAGRRAGALRMWKRVKKGVTGHPVPRKFTSTNSWHRLDLSLSHRGARAHAEARHAVGSAGQELDRARAHLHAEVGVVHHAHHVPRDLLGLPVHRGVPSAAQNLGRLFRPERRELDLRKLERRA
eukprot:5120482-Pleurochrysis_carterae.AAC.2